MMTCRLQLLCALLAAAAVVSGSPLQQTTDSGDGTGDTTMTGAEPTTHAGPATGTTAATPAETTEAAEPAVEIPAVDIPAADVGTENVDPAVEKTAGANQEAAAPEKMTLLGTGEMANSVPEETTTPGPAAEATDPGTPAPATEEPVTEPSETTERIHGGLQTTETTVPAGITDGGDTVPAPVCAAILSSTLSHRTFRRDYLYSFTTCRCESDMHAHCQPKSYYQAVRPGTASAVHAQEQSGGNSPAVLAAQVFGLQLGCVRRAKPGVICFFGEHLRQPYCDCTQGV